MNKLKMAAYFQALPSASHRNLQFLIALLVSLTFQLISGFFIDERQSPETHRWSYENQQEWRVANRQCSLSAQSPIDIQRKLVIPNHQLKLRFYNYDQPIRFKMQNAHHTIKLDPIDSQRQHQQQSHHHNQQKVQPGEPAGKPNEPETNSAGDNSTLALDLLGDTEDGSEETEFVSTLPANVNRPPTRIGPHEADEARQAAAGRPLEGNSLDDQSLAGNSLANDNRPYYNGVPTIKLDWLDDDNNEYRLRDIHFHWGERNNNGSEHAIDGKRAAMEMHLVHIKHGLDKSKIGFTSDSVTVIAILIEPNRLRGNANFLPIIDALGSVNMTEKHQEIEYKLLADLLPDTMENFYTYSGSLTTPPCYQVVNWIVMEHRLLMNARHLEDFRNLFAPTNAAGGHEHNHESPMSSKALADQTPPITIMPNIRHLQRLNNRTILASFSPFGKYERPLGSGSTSCFTAIGNQVYLLFFATALLNLAIKQSAR